VGVGVQPPDLVLGELGGGVGLVHRGVDRVVFVEEGFQVVGGGRDGVGNGVGGLLQLLGR
jgi:hypothetical protein